MAGSQRDGIYAQYHGNTAAMHFMGLDALNGGMDGQPMAAHLQPPVMPQWPSMLSSQSHANYRPVYPAPVQPIQPISMGALHTPVSATSSRSATTPQKTLTDLDRKRMCQYAEEHPNSKHAQIGAIFGVERSTISKVLQRKREQMSENDGCCLSIKSAKRGSPDIERALAVWAKKQESEGLPLTNDMIRGQARAFSAVTTTPGKQEALSDNWIKNFRLKNKLMGGWSRKSSMAPDDNGGTSKAASAAHNPSGIPPAPASGIPSSELHGAQSQGSPMHEISDGNISCDTPTVYHSSVSRETASYSSATGALTPTSDCFISSSETASGAYVLAVATDDMFTNMEESPDPQKRIDGAVHHTRPNEHAAALARATRPTSATSSSPMHGAISLEKAQQALEDFISFVEGQGIVVTFNDTILLGGLAEKMRQQSRAGG